MKLLLDTHALLWWLADDAALRAEAKAAIASPDNLVMVSAASAWEIAIKRALGKLSAPTGLEAMLVANDFEALPIAVAHAEAAGALPRHHDDPFDRVLIAQAQLLGLTLVSRDANMTKYDVSVLSA